MSRGNRLLKQEAASQKRKTTRGAGGGMAEPAAQAFDLFALTATFLRLRYALRRLRF
jgi:hypothetical protein